MNNLNWLNAPETDDVHLYLRVMRDLKSYCKRGYCEIDIAIINFVQLPKTLILRMLPTLVSSRVAKRFVIDWNDRESMHRFFRVMLAIICELNHQQFNNKAFNDAFEYIQ